MKAKGPEPEEQPDSGYSWMKSSYSFRLRLGSMAWAAAHEHGGEGENVSMDMGVRIRGGERLRHTCTHELAAAAAGRLRVAAPCATAQGCQARHELARSAGAQAAAG